MRCEAILKLAIAHDLHMTTGLPWCPAFGGEQDSLGLQRDGDFDRTPCGSYSATG
jgi:hypothetical protein